jgi:hypothetical protein
MIELQVGCFPLDFAEEIWIKTSETMLSMPLSREKPRLDETSTIMNSGVLLESVN